MYSFDMLALSLSHTHTHTRTHTHAHTQTDCTCNQMFKPRVTYHTLTHILQGLSTKQRRGSHRVQQRFNLALTSTADQDGVWQQFPSNEYLCNSRWRHRGQCPVTIHCAVTVRDLGFSWRVGVYTRKNSHAQRHTSHTQVPQPDLTCICAALLWMENSYIWKGRVMVWKSLSQKQ